MSRPRVGNSPQEKLFPFRADEQTNVKVDTAATVQIEGTGLICDGQIVQAILSDCIQYVTKIVDGFGRMFFGE